MEGWLRGAAGPLARRLVPQGRVRFGRRVVKVSRLRSVPSDSKPKDSKDTKTAAQERGGRRLRAAFTHTSPQKAII